MTTKIRLSDILSPAFRKVHTALMSGKVNQIVLKGGRGSTKSSYASVEDVLLLVRNPEIHAVVVRKVANTLRTSVFAQYEWAINMLGLASKFKFTVSPMEMTYLPTGQKIMFFGADDPGKLKSIKVPFGYIGILHFEELDQFSGEEEVRNIEQSILRGGPLAFEFKSFNPPKTRDNWANLYCMTDKPGQLIHHSTYLTTPPEWLGERFLHDAEYLRDINPSAYEHEYMGVATGTGGAIFDNLDIKHISQDERDDIDYRYYGIDWGFAIDPAVYIECGYDRKKQTLYLLRELYGSGMVNRVFADKIMALDKGYRQIYADSAEPKSVMDMRDYGLEVQGVNKWPGSVKNGIEFLQGLNKIIIDRDLCPNAAREFQAYEYEQDKNGNFISQYPDKNNHTIDAVRYAMVNQVLERKQRLKR